MGEEEGEERRRGGRREEEGEHSIIGRLNVMQESLFHPRINFANPICVCECVCVRVSVRVRVRACARASLTFVNVTSFGNFKLQVSRDAGVNEQLDELTVGLSKQRGRDN